MAKRQTDSRKWDDPWFCSLSLIDRSYWLYMLDKCTHYGLYQEVPALIKAYFGDYKPDYEVFQDRVVCIGEGKYFIPKFISFQYGLLNDESESPMLKRVVNELKRNNLWDLYNSYINPNPTVPVPYPHPTPRVDLPFKEKEKEKEKDKEKEGDRGYRGKGRPDSKTEVMDYMDSIGEDASEGDRFYDYYEANGWKVGRNPMKNWQAAARNWLKSDFRKKHNRDKSPEQLTKEFLIRQGIKEGS